MRQATLALVLMVTALISAGTTVAADSRAAVPLAIDYATYIGGPYNDAAQAVAVDTAGNTWVAGQGDALFPDHERPTQVGGGVFVRKFGPAGTPQFTLYFRHRDLGMGASIASVFDSIGGIGVDAAGNAYIVATGEDDVPLTVPAPAPCPDDDRSIYVLKLSPAGTILYATRLCGGHEYSFARGRGIAVSPAGYAVIAGYTYSEHFTTTPGALIPAIPSQFTSGHFGDTGFVARFNPAGQVVFSTFLGGGTVDRAFAVATDASGNAYVTGEAFSPDFPTTAGSMRTTWLNRDAFVVKLSPSGALVYGTFVGGLGDEVGYGIAVSAGGEAVVTGPTSSGSPEIPAAYRFPVTAGAFQESPGHQAMVPAAYDGFVARLSSSADGLVFATYLGGDADDQAQAVALDALGRVYVTGYTSSSDYPTLNAPQATRRGSSDAFVTVLSAGGSGLMSTYLGGTGRENDPAMQSYATISQEQRSGIAVDAAGSARVVGFTDSTDFPVREAYQSENVRDATYHLVEAFLVRYEPPPGNSLVRRTTAPLLARD